MSAALCAPAVPTTRAVEEFIVNYVAHNGDERNEVRAADCISAAAWEGFTESAVIKARHRIRHRIGSRRASRRWDIDSDGTRWFLLFDPNLLADSTAAECAEGVADQLAGEIIAARPLLTIEQRNRLIDLLRHGVPSR